MGTPSARVLICSFPCGTCTGASRGCGRERARLTCDACAQVRWPVCSNPSCWSTSLKVRHAFILAWHSFWQCQSSSQQAEAVCIASMPGRQRSQSGTAPGIYVSLSAEMTCYLQRGVVIERPMFVQQAQLPGYMQIPSLVARPRCLSARALFRAQLQQGLCRPVGRLPARRAAFLIVPQ